MAAWPAIALCALLAASLAQGQVCPHTVTLQSAACPGGLNCQTTPGATLITTQQFDESMLDIAYLCQNADAAPAGGVTSVAMTVPSWLSVTGSPITSTGTLAISAASGQTSGRVIGTCGSATSVGVCALTDADIPNNITVDVATLATTATTANAGDSATAFFSSGTVEAARLPNLDAMNGAVTDSQVPDTITKTGTANKCAHFNGSGVLEAATGDCAAGDTTGGGGGGTGQYDPDTPDPGVTYFCDEEWNAGSDSCSPTWGNQGSATASYVLDRLVLTTPYDVGGGENQRVRWITAPSATDFTVCTKITPRLAANYNAAGVNFLVAGTIASPTTIINCALLHNNAIQAVVTRNNSYTSFNSDLSNLGNLYYEALLQHTVYIRSRYVASTKALICGWSLDGFEFREAAAQTLSAHPLYLGIYVNANTTAGVSPLGWFDFYRVRTDGPGVADPWPCGGVP